MQVLKFFAAAIQLFLLISIFQYSNRFFVTAAFSQLDKLNISYAQLHPNAWYNSSGHLAHTIHSDDWIPMTAAESLDFFSLREVCSLNLNLDACRDLPGLSDHYVPLCEAQERGVVHTNRKCSNNRGFFLRHKTHELGRNSFAELIRHMKKMGDNTILLVGDSVTSHMFNDAYCSGKRLGLYIRNLSRRPRLHPNLPGLAYIYESENYKRQDKNFMVQVMHLSEIGKISDNLFNITSDLSKYHINGNMIVVVNIGLHIHSGDELKTLLLHLIAQTVELAKKGHIVFFRETSAQHFDSATGLYEGSNMLKFRGKKNITVPIRLIGEKLGLLEPSRPQDVIDNITNPDLHFSCVPIQTEEAMKKQNWRTINSIHNRGLVSYHTIR